MLKLLAEGLGPTEIAAQLGISAKTVATHVEHIYAKLGVHTRAQAVASRSASRSSTSERSSRVGSSVDVASVGVPTQD